MSKTKPEQIQVEKNLQQWSIWQPPRSRNKLDELTFVREILEGGNSIVAQVEVKASQYGALTTEDQKVLYALQKLWEEEGRPEKLSFSRRKLARVLGKNFNSEGITQSLYRLRFTAFVFTHAFYRAQEKRLVETTDTFTILSSLQLLDTSEGTTNTESCTGELHNLIRENLNHNYTQPLFFQVVVGFKDGIAQILYTYLDSVLAFHPVFTKRTTALFEDLNLVGAEYGKKSSRKRTLERILGELEGKPLSPGGTLSVRIEITEDGKDFKLIARRVGVGSEPSQTFEAEVPEGIFSGHQLVRLFLAAFHHTRKPRPSEVAKAQWAIREYALSEDLGNRFIKFCQLEAPKTNYQPATFQGIVKYLDFPWKKSEQPMEPVPSGVQAAITLLAEDELEAAGLVLLSRLDPQESARLIENQRQVLLNSEKRKVFQRWSKETMFEHCQRLVAISLAAKGS